MTEAFPVFLTAEEHRKIEHLAKRFGVSVEEMATALVQAGIAKRVRRRTGKAPAKTYQLKGKS